jgi:hypothetical protein
MKKDWIKQRHIDAGALFNQMGISSRAPLSSCHLLIHVSYGNEDGGQTIIAKPGQINIRGSSIEFIFHHPVQVDLDAHLGGLGGDLAHMHSTESFLITALTFHHKRWSATTDEDGAAGQINENINVEIITL